MSVWNKKSNTLLILAALGLIVLLCLIYTISKYTNRSVWHIVPTSAIIVVEIRDFAQQWQHLQNTAVWEELRQIPFFTRLEQHAKQLELFIPEEKAFYISLHLTARDNFDGIFYLPIKKINIEQTELYKIFTNSSSVSQTRFYQGEELLEFTSREGNTVLTCWQADSYYLFSTTPYLIEDAIRAYRSLGHRDFRNHYPDLFAIKQWLAETPIRIYLNWERLQQLASIFTNQHTGQLLQYLTGNLLLGMEITTSGIKWQGATANGNKKSLTFFLKDNPPTSPLTLIPHIPAETAYLYRLGAAEGKLLYQQLRQYWALHQPEYLNKQDSLAEKTGLDVEFLYSQLKGQIALVVSEWLPEGKEDRCTLIAFKDNYKALRHLEQAAKETFASPKDTLLTERYGKFRIVRLPLPDLPYILFGQPFEGFKQVYATANSEYLVLANRLTALKNYLNAIEQGNTWALPEKQYLTEGLDSASHLNLIVQHKRNWTRQRQYLNPKADSYAMAHMQQWLFFTHFSFALIGKPEGNFNASIFLGTQRKRKSSKESLVKLWEIDLAHSLRQPPQLVINHYTRSTELIFQDRANQLWLVSASGKKLWHLPLQSPVTSHYCQIDYLNNNKLQYLFATTEAVYLVDRLGRIVSGFPFRFHQSKIIDQLSAIDYDNSKDYRFAVATIDGDIFLTNKSGQILQGWAPRKTSGSLAVPLKHVRVYSRDCMTALHYNGVVMLMKRNGESYPGFPVTLSKEVFPNMNIEVGEDFSRSYLQVLTKDGDLIRINFNGQIIQRRQYYEDAKGGLFTFCIDQNGGNRWIVTRQVRNQLTGMDMNGKAIFQIALPDEHACIVQFFALGAGADLVAVTHLESATCRLYLSNGYLLTPQPIPTQQPVAIYFNEASNALHVYAAPEGKLQAWQLTL